MKLDKIPEPIIGAEYKDGFICPKCGTAGPTMQPQRFTEGFTLRVQCPKCGFYADYVIGGRDDS